jgi:hypothetical protein
VDLVLTRAPRIPYHGFDHPKDGLHSTILINISALGTAAIHSPSLLFQDVLGDYLLGISHVASRNTVEIVQISARVAHSITHPQRHVLLLRSAKTCYHHYHRTCCYAANHSLNTRVCCRQMDCATRMLLSTRWAERFVIDVVSLITFS